MTYLFIFPGKEFEEKIKINVYILCFSVYLFFKEKNFISTGTACQQPEAGFSYKMF
jgi:hypothetical protein